MSIALAAPDARRLSSLFIHNRPVPARDLARPVRGRRLDRAFNVTKVVAIAYMVCLAAFMAHRGWTVQGGGAPVSAWQGTWIVQAPATGAPPPAAEQRDWTRLAFDEHSALVRRADGSASRLRLRGDAVAGTLALRSKTRGASALTFNFDFEQPEPDVLLLTSTSPPSTLRLKRQRSEEQPLLAHELRWIRDLPSAEQNP
jgi:hypothetical protein